MMVCLGGAAVAALGVLALAHGGPNAPRSHLISAITQRLAQLHRASRRDIDYAALDARLDRMAHKPTMVGLAVGVVENGRITFLHGYGETQAGSGDPVTPRTVFRWASCSKGLAATMVAKLAELGKIDLGAPVDRYSASRRDRKSVV